MSLDAFVQFLFDVAIVACGTITIARVWFEGSIFEPYREAFRGKYYNDVLHEAEYQSGVTELLGSTPIVRPGLVGFIDQRAPVWLCELVSCRLCLTIHISLWLALIVTLHVICLGSVGLFHGIFHMAGSFFCGHAGYMLLNKVTPISAPTLDGRDE